jgi:hypothetical protein
LSRSDGLSRLQKNLRERPRPAASPPPAAAKTPYRIVAGAPILEAHLDPGGYFMKRPLLILVLGAAACVHTNAALMDVTQKLPPLCPDGVKVFSDTSKVGKPYQEVALLNSKGESGSTSEEGMIKSQRKKAAQVGANGIVLGGFQEPKAGTKIIGALLGTGAERKGSALAIYIPADSSRVRAACNGTDNRY